MNPHHVKLCETLNGIANDMACIKTFIKHEPITSPYLCDWIVSRNGRDFVSVYLEIIDPSTAVPLYTLTVRDYRASVGRSEYLFTEETVSTSQLKRLFRQAITIAAMANKD